MSLLLRPVIDVKLAYGYGTVVLGTIAATGLVALIDAVMMFAVVAPLPNAAASIMSVAIILAVISLVVMILRHIAAVAIVAVTLVALEPVVIPGNPAAVHYVALVVVAVLPEDAVATSGKSAVTVGTAMTLQRKSVVETEMVLSVIRRGGNAVMRADV